jgi:diguanylate cyclase (GGDEF)-like protein
MFGEVRGTMRRAIRWLQRQGYESIVISAAVLVALVGVVDYLTLDRLDCTVGYAIPVVLVSFIFSGYYGVLFVVTSVLGSLWADTLTSYASLTSATYLVSLISRLGLLLMLVGAFSALRRSQRQALALVRNDPLTGIANSATFYDIGDREVSRCHRHKHPLTLAVMDCDNFHEINDRFGRNTGDAILCLAARSIAGNVRSTDVAARLRDDIFVMLLPDTNDTAAVQVIERLQQRLYEAMRHEDWPVTCSVGAVTFFQPPATVDEIVHHAEALLQVAKRSGKNQIKHALLSV